jgi:hypothetical protein
LQHHHQRGTLRLVRNEPPFRCQQCGDETGAGHECLRCGTALTDINDRKVVELRTHRYRIIGRAGMFARVVWLLLTACGTAALVGNLDHWKDDGFLVGLIVVIGMLALAAVAARQLWGPRWRDRLRRRSIARRLRAFGPATRIASAKGRARICGRTRVLSSVRVGHIDAAVGLVRAPLERDGVTHGSGKPLAPIMQERATCGRFLVDDGTDMALVDEDAFEIGPRRGALPLWRGSILAARDGDEVVVAGPCRREPVSDPALRKQLQREGYRQAAQEVLTFDGGANDRVIILCDHIGPLPTAHSR